jgi:hypothetical protein
MELTTSRIQVPGVLILGITAGELQSERYHTNKQASPLLPEDIPSRHGSQRQTG